MPRASEALRKENVNKCLESAAVDQAVFAIQLSILNRMSFLAGVTRVESTLNERQFGAT
jgi:hypothetical protein